MSKVYADIIVDISQEKLDKSFQYEIPKEIQNQVEIGKKVLVSFGNGSRKISGYVIGISDKPKISPEKIKPVLEVVTQGIEIESHLISLAGWIAKSYGSTINQALKTVLLVKEKTSAKEKKIYTPCDFKRRRTKLSGRIYKKASSGKSPPYGSSFTGTGVGI